MNVIFTCGGTAGHVNPALALARYIEERHTDARILFVGTPNGMERALVEKAGYDFDAVKVSNFRRSLSAEGFRHNMETARTLITSRSEADAILRRFRPDLVIGTGGYASYPMIKAAARHGIPTAVHESNMIPGLTTKLLEGCADKIMVGFEDCRQHYKHPEKIVVTGTPVRGDFFTLTRAQARQALGVPDGQMLVVSFWGSLGASTMNDRIVDVFRREKAEGYPFHHIHGAGNVSWDTMRQRLQSEGLLHPALDVRQYIYDMNVVMRGADLVISRAGASTLSELTALGMPSILVPSPYVVANHQEKNARLLEHHGGAVVLTEAEATGEVMYDTAKALLSDPEKLSAMSRGMAELGILDATERIYRTVTSLL